MRSIDKGVSPRIYTHYRQATLDLIDRIGCYCSYCEMRIDNEPDVEHIEPKSGAGALNAWENFLLGCKKCNKIKSAKNPDRSDHLWPDEDNTSLAFEYYNEIMVRLVSGLNEPFKTYAQNTLHLVGIDRIPGKIANPNQKDKRDRRWQARKKAWDYAHKCRTNWQNNPSPELLDAIADVAEAAGFFSVWQSVFAGIPDVLLEISGRYSGTYHPVINPDGTQVIRPGGKF